MELTELKGIGPKTAESFAKIGVHNVEELLSLYPRDYELFYAPVTIAEIGIKTFATIRGIFLSKPSVRKVKKLQIITADLMDETGSKLRAVWFNTPFIRDMIEPGRVYIVKGRITRKFGVLQIEQPRAYTEDEYHKLIGKHQPVYPLTKGLTNNIVVKAVKQALQTEAFNLLDENDPVPAVINDEYGFCSKKDAVKNIHFPESSEQYKQALNKLAFEEIFLFIYQMKKHDQSTFERSDYIVEENEKTAGFLGELPFSFTSAQKRVYEEIKTDMASGRRMNRLVQGDVGSGKTIIALAALMNCAFAGYQGALMAPTEVLAAQHYETISGYFKKYNIDLNVALLTGSMSTLEKKVVYDALEDGKINIIIGTHALIQEKVRFMNPGLVITDEQHRFGIKQREKLAGMSESVPHVLVMSATPIPRTLALIIYGGMDVSVIDELPSERKPIKNAVIDESYRANAYRLMKREIAKGRQVYIICPLVEYSEGVEAQNVTDYSEMLKEIFDDGTVIGMLHGQMSAAKKNEVMEKFASGQIQILVSTTVVEVGVNVPNATVMMIEDADRFGLAALHQLRGRVGRGSDQSYCMFMSSKKSPEAIERLNVLASSNDGFKIAAKDLEMRGPGEFNGIRQSGMLNFNAFDVYRDAELAQQALKAVGKVIDCNIEMPDLNLETSVIL